MKFQYDSGDIVRLKKPHPCGSYDWEIDVSENGVTMKCLKCDRGVIMERTLFERRIRGVQKAPKGAKPHNVIELE